MLSETEYTEIKARYDAYHEARMRLPHPQCVTPEDAQTLPPSVPNDEISALEVYEFLRDKPERYFAYLSEDGKRITTWTGDTLGRTTGYATEWRSNFGDKRRAFRVVGINGVEYATTAYVDSGTYVRMRAVKPR